MVTVEPSMVVLEVQNWILGVKLDERKNAINTFRYENKAKENDAKHDIYKNV